MPSWMNLLVQIAAVLAVGVLRFLSPGWLLIIFFVFVPVASVALILQIVVAGLAMVRRTLHTAVLVPSVAMVVLELGAALLIQDGGDGESSFSRPFDVLFGTHLGAGADSLGFLFVLGWIAAAVAALVAVIVTWPRRQVVVPPPPFAMVR